MGGESVGEGDYAGSDEVEGAASAGGEGRENRRRFGIARHEVGCDGTVRNLTIGSDKSRIRSLSLNLCPTNEVGTQVDTLKIKCVPRYLSFPPSQVNFECSNP